MHHPRGMNMPNFAAAPVLNTDAEVLQRVGQLVGPATTDHQLWIMLVDGDSRQAPVVAPVSDIPRRPGSNGLAGLAEILGGLGDELATDRGPGSVILTLERLGTDAMQPADREWAVALAAACERAGMALRGIFLSTPAGVVRIQ